MPEHLCYSNLVINAVYAGRFEYLAWELFLMETILLELKNSQPIFCVIRLCGEEGHKLLYKSGKEEETNFLHKILLIYF